MGSVRSLNVILMLLGAFAVLLLGVMPSAAMPTEAPPCHEAPAHAQAGHQAPAPSGKAMAAMACCVACVVAPALQPPPRELTARPARPAPPVPASLPIGRMPAPEHGPPKA
jgi:hypothetical protein